MAEEERTHGHHESLTQHEDTGVHGSLQPVFDCRLLIQCGHLEVYRVRSGTYHLEECGDQTLN